MWVVVHSLVWDGAVSNTGDILASLTSPLTKADLSSQPTGSLTERLTFNSINELSLTKLWNFFADPNPSTRNLFLNVGWVGFHFTLLRLDEKCFVYTLVQATASHILWILPTFIGTVPDSSERLGGLPSNLAAADPVTLWNRLMCPQCILQIIGINTLNVSISRQIFAMAYFPVQWVGRIIWWVVLSTIPDVAGRSMAGQSGLLAEVARYSLDTGRELLVTQEWRYQLLSRL